MAPNFEASTIAGWNVSYLTANSCSRRLKRVIHGASWVRSAAPDIAIRRRWAEYRPNVDHLRRGRQGGREEGRQIWSCLGQTRFLRSEPVGVGSRATDTSQLCGRRRSGAVRLDRPGRLWAAARLLFITSGRQRRNQRRRCVSWCHRRAGLAGQRGAAVADLTLLRCF